MKKSVLFSAIAAVAFAAQANAAVIQISTGPVAAYDNTTAFNPVAFNSSLNPATKGVAYEIPVNFTLSSLASGQSFGNIAFNVTWDGDLVKDNGGGPYSPSSQTFPNGKTPAAYYSINGDQGGSNTDLQGIVASFPAGTAAAARSTAGTSGPFLIGYVYFDLPSGATHTSHVNVTVTGYSLNDNGNLVTQDLASVQQAAPVTFGVPEPTSIAGLGLAAFGLAARRRQA